ncbi:MAG: hypothetical protein H7Z41_02625 [Cytophagales bacterium]|nr:hypothetical protein [Armatimonadota bacterium]
MKTFLSATLLCLTMVAVTESASYACNLCATPSHTDPLIIPSILMTGASASGSQSITGAGSQTSNLGSFGITINPGSALAANTAALAAFNRGAAQWGSRIFDPITININANLGTFANNNIIGSTGSVLLQSTFDDIRGAVVDDAADEADDAIVAALPTAAQASFITPTGFGIANAIVLTKANAKALGFEGLDTVFGATDATITFNSAFSFDYDSSDGIGAGLVDFETVAAHEIGHALGFVSIVDSVDALLSQGRTQNLAIRTLDLFRFQNNVAGADPSTVEEFTSFPRFLLTGGDAITDELTGEYRMSTAVANGDGRQASHWKDDSLTGLTIGIMDPTLANQTITPVGDRDFRALDLIGYDILPRLEDSMTAPEPTSAALVCIGLLVIPIAARRRR